MAKSVRIHLSVPQGVYAVFAEMGDLSGVGTAGAMVHALTLQSAYARRWIQTFNYEARDPRGTQIEDKAGVMYPAPDPFDPDLEEVQPDRTPLTRQQRRQLEREERKRRR